LRAKLRKKNQKTFSICFIILQKKQKSPKSVKSSLFHPFFNDFENFFATLHQDVNENLVKPKRGKHAPGHTRLFKNGAVCEW
jgi:hypothetical protein